MSSSMFPLDWYPEDTPIDAPTMDEKVVAYCAEEVRRQGDTQWHVYKMYKAWMFAHTMYMIDYVDHVPHFTPMLIRQLGKEIDEANELGFRTTSIFIYQPDGRHIEKMNPTFIDPAIVSLCERQYQMPALDVYAEFEEIHPFGDGNGRVGKVLYNWRNGSLHDPVWPKDLYGGISNP